jgi:hypothetical protein
MADSYLKPTNREGRVAPSLRVYCMYDQGDTLNLIMEYSEITLILLAAKDGDEALMERLIDEWSDIDRPDSSGKTVLIKAVEAVEHTLVAALLAHGAEVNLKDRKGLTALHYAALSGNFELVEYLLRAGADITKSDVAGKKPRDYATQQKTRVIFNNPPPVLRRARQTRESVQPAPKALQGSQALAAKTSEAVIYYFQWIGSTYESMQKEANRTSISEAQLATQSKTMSVYDLIYDSTFYEVEQSKTGFETAKAFRWIHLPANNVRCKMCTNRIHLTIK